MEFLLKKLISIFIMPFSLGMLMLLIGLFLLYRHNLNKAKVLLTFSFVWLFFISYSPFVNTLLYPYENIYSSLKKVPQDIKYIYVLGGGHHTNPSHPITSQINRNAVVRLTEAIRLYRVMKKKPILILSGYSGLHDPNSHALMQQKLALALGVKPKHIHLASTPKDTYEETIEAKKYIKNSPFIVVTSASHICRALALFHKQNLYPIPAPTNHLASIDYPDYMGLFSTTTLEKSKKFWHELIGSIWSRLRY